MGKQVEPEIRLRITLLNPPSEVVFCRQRGRSDLASCTWADGVVTGPSADEVFAKPPWQAEERRP